MKPNFIEQSEGTTRNLQFGTDRASAPRDNPRMKTLILFFALLMLVGCNREGPAEKAGRNIDQAGKDASRSIEKAGENVRDAVKGKK
jgi:hypothetical protein